MNNKLTPMIIYPEFNNAVLGITTDNRMIYDYDNMVDVLMAKPNNMTYDDAVDYLDYNVLDAYISDKQPIIVNIATYF